MNKSQVRSFFLFIYLVLICCGVQALYVDLTIENETDSDLEFTIWGRTSMTTLGYEKDTSLKVNAKSLIKTKYFVPSDTIKDDNIHSDLIFIDFKYQPNKEKLDIVRETIKESTLFNNDIANVICGMLYTKGTFIDQTLTNKFNNPKSKYYMPKKDVYYKQ
ncbi:MAG: hypothetical protein HRT87_06285 [Legionellales bacterium]|nr:hypothetical protein [Legionellales bacterium]